MSPDALDAMSPPCPRPKATEAHNSMLPDAANSSPEATRSTPLDATTASHEAFITPPPDATRTEAVRTSTYDATLVDTTASSKPLAQSNVEGANMNYL